MGIFDIFRKKQQQPLPPFEIAPPPLDIPPPEPPAEYGGNAPYVPPSASSPQSSSQAAESAPVLPPDIEGKISVPSMVPGSTPLPDLPPPELPAVLQTASQHSDIGDIPEHELLKPASLPEFPEFPSGKDSAENGSASGSPEFTSPESLSGHLPGYASSFSSLGLPPLPEASHLDTLPDELPPLSSEAVAWPAFSSPPALAERSFVFVHSDAFSGLLSSVDDIRDAARRNAKLSMLGTLKNKEDSDLNRLQGDLESIQRKLLYIDTELFEKQAAYTAVA